MGPAATRFRATDSSRRGRLWEGRLRACRLHAADVGIDREGTRQGQSARRWSRSGGCVTPAPSAGAQDEGESRGGRALSTAEEKWESRRASPVLW